MISKNGTDTNQCYEPTTSMLKLERILTAFCHHCPDIGYCQGMNYIAGLILLVMEEEEEVSFWLFYTVIQKIMPQGYYSGNMLAAKIDQDAFQVVLEKRLPKLAAHLDRANIPISVVSLPWFITCFSGTCPVEVR